MLLIQIRCEALKAADIVFYYKAFATKLMASGNNFITHIENLIKQVVVIPNKGTPWKMVIEAGGSFRIRAVINQSIQDGKLDKPYN